MINEQKRPLLISILVVLIFIGVFFELVLGPLTKTGDWYYLRWFGRIVEVITLIGFVIAAIGLWKLKEWARQITIGLMGLSILINIFVIRKLVNLYEWAKNYYVTSTSWGYGWEPIAQREFKGTPYLIKYGVLLFSTVLEIIILGLIIFYLTRPKVKAVFGGDGIKAKDITKKGKDLLARAGKAKEAFTKKK